MAIPPTPPKAKTPEIEKPKCCIKAKMAVIMTAAFTNFPIASTVVLSQASLFFPGRANMATTTLTKRTANQETSIINKVSRKVATKLSVSASKAWLTIPTTHAIPTTQTPQAKGLRATSNSASSHSFSVFLSFIANCENSLRTKKLNSSTANTSKNILLSKIDGEESRPKLSKY